MMTLRPPQALALSSILDEFTRVQRTMLVLPTGVGKTIVFSFLAKHFVEAGGKVLILAHREELIVQACNKLKAATGIDAAIEKAEQEAHDTFHDVTVASVQTLCRPKRLARFRPDQFDLIIVDEGHHAISASYQAILTYFSAKVLLVTATPDRGDKKNLGQIVESCAFEYSLRDAIVEGYLCPITVETIPLKIDLTQVSTSKGDYDQGELGTALTPYIPQIITELATRCANRKTLVFTPLCAIAQTFRDAARAGGIDAYYASGVYRDEMSAFEAAGKNSMLFNAMLVTEGYDHPAIDAVVVLRATKVRGLYAQMIGRGTRILPGKDNLLILDFLWLTAQHDLVHPVHLVTGAPEVIEKTIEMMENAGGPMDLMMAEAVAAKTVIAEREKALARRLRENATKKARSLDPLAFCMSLDEEDLALYEPTLLWEMRPPSAGQIAALEKFGFNAEDLPNCGLASKILDKCIGRIKANLSSPKQINLLRRFGYDNAHTFTHAHASELITKIAENNWRRPADEPKPALEEAPF
jgi:superfamily II DNA or RNA helicase